MDYISEIKSLAEEGRQLGIFGSTNNGVNTIFLPTATMQEIHNFEREANIKLPDAYVRFLTEIGNGAYSIPYPIYGLKELAKMLPYIKEKADIPILYDHTFTDADWKAFGKKYEEIENKIYEIEERDPNVADSLYKELRDMEQRFVAGSICISTLGCTMDILLMYKGMATGEVVLADFDYMGQINGDPGYGRFEDWLKTVMHNKIQACKKDPKIRNRALTTDHLDEFISLYQQELHEEGKLLRLVSFTFNKSAFRKNYVQRMKQELFSGEIALDHGKVVGIAGITIVSKSLSSGGLERTTAVLSEMYILPEYRRKGIGKMLLWCVKTWAEWHNCDVLLAQIPALEIGVQFLQSYGFTKKHNTMKLDLDKR